MLLAHPELNASFQSAPERLEALVEGGVLLQITGASLLRTPGTSASAKLARWMVEQEVAHVIASDSHTGGAWRPSEMMAAHRAARQLAPHRASWMVNAAPAAILAGEPLPPAPARAASVPAPARTIEATARQPARRPVASLSKLRRRRRTSG